VTAIRPVLSACGWNRCVRQLRAAGARRMVCDFFRRRMGLGLLTAFTGSTGCGVVRGGRVRRRAMSVMTRCLTQEPIHPTAAEPRPTSAVQAA
jgi:hypothetical protein